HHFRFLPFNLCFCLFLSGDSRDLHSFPTRRSSDLGQARKRGEQQEERVRRTGIAVAGGDPRGGGGPPQLGEAVVHREQRATDERSEEHTSELQSRFDLVCRLLLEKKKKTTIQTYNE